MLLLIELGSCQSATRHVSQFVCGAVNGSVLLDIDGDVEVSSPIVRVEIYKGCVIRGQLRFVSGAADSRSFQSVREGRQLERSHVLISGAEVRGGIVFNIGLDGALIVVENAAVGCDPVYVAPVTSEPATTTSTNTTGKTFSTTAGTASSNATTTTSAPSPIARAQPPAFPGASQQAFAVPVSPVPPGVALRFKAQVVSSTIQISHSALCAVGRDGLTAGGVYLDDIVNGSIVGISDTIINVSTSVDLSSGNGISFNGGITSTFVTLSGSTSSVICDSVTTLDCVALSSIAVKSGSRIEVNDGMVLRVTTKGAKVAAIRWDALSDSAVVMAPRIGGPFGSSGFNVIAPVLTAKSFAVAMDAFATTVSVISIFVTSSFSATGQPTAVHGIELASVSNSTILLGASRVVVQGELQPFGLSLGTVSGDSGIVVAVMETHVSPILSAAATPTGVAIGAVQGSTVRFLACQVVADSRAGVLSYGVTLGPTIATAVIDVMGSNFTSTGRNGVALTISGSISVSLSLISSTLHCALGAASTALLVDQASNTTLSALFVQLNNFGALGVKLSNLGSNLVVVANHLVMSTPVALAEAWKGTASSFVTKCSTATVSGSTVDLETIALADTVSIMSCGGCAASVDCGGGVNPVNVVSSVFAPAPALTSRSSTTAAPRTSSPNGTSASASGNTAAPTSNPATGKCDCYRCDTLPSLLSEVLKAKNRDATASCFFNDSVPTGPATSSTLFASEGTRLSFVYGWRAAAKRQAVRTWTQSKSAPVSLSHTLLPTPSGLPTQTATEFVTSTVSSTWTRPFVPTRTKTVTRTPPRTKTHSLSQVPAPIPPRTVLARAFSAAGVSRVNADRLGTSTAVLLGVLAIVSPHSGNKGIGLDRLADNVECHWNPYDSSMTTPPYRTVVYPFAFGTSALSYIQGAIVQTALYALFFQALTVLCAAVAPRLVTVRVVLGLLAVASFVYFAPAASYYSMLAVVAGTSTQERSFGGMGLLITALIMFFPAHAATSMPQLHLAYRMFITKARDYVSPYVRMHLFVDAACGSLLGLIGAFRFPLSEAEQKARGEVLVRFAHPEDHVVTGNRMNCAFLAGASLLVSLAYTVYVLCFRPIADKLQLLSLLLMTVLQLAASVTAMVVVFKPDALFVLGYISVSQLGVACVNVILVVFVEASNRARRQAEEQAAELEAERRASELEKVAPLLRLPDSSDDDGEGITLPDKHPQHESIEDTERMQLVVRDPEFAAQTLQPATIFNVFELEQVATEAWLGPQQVASPQHDDDPTLTAAERRLRTLRRLRAQDAAEKEMLTSELGEIEFRLAHTYDKALRHLAKHQTFGFGRPVDEVDAELILQWLREMSIDVSALVDDATPDGQNRELIAARTIARAIHEHSAVSRNARAAALLAAMTQLRKAPTPAAPPVPPPPDNPLGNTREARRLYSKRRPED